MTRARRSRSASAWRDIERFIDSGRVTSLTSTRSTLTPHGSSDGASMISVSSAPSFSRLESSSSSSALPMTERSDVWASWEMANW